MQRQRVLIVAILALVIAGALALALLRDRPRPGPISVDAADENASEPYHQEMDCVDRLLQDRNLIANEVEPALARCRVDAFGNESPEE